MDQKRQPEVCGATLTTPEHEKILRIYGHSDENGYGSKGYYEAEDFSLDEKLRTACEDACPSLDDLFNQKRRDAIIQLLNQGANPALVDENGDNALMLFSGQNRSRATESIDLEYLGASEGGRKNKVQGVDVNFIFYKGRPIYEGDDLYSEGISQGKKVFEDFKANEEQLRLYKKELEQQIKDLSREIAEIVVPSLLAKGLDINATNKDGKTALVIADEKGNDELKQVLLKSGANEFDLKLRRPQYKYLVDQNDFRNISCEKLGCEWSGFISQIFESLSNAKLRRSSYPLARLNTEDNSVSFFFESFEGGEEKRERLDMFGFLSRDYVKEQFKFHAKHGAKITEGGHDKFYENPDKLNFKAGSQVIKLEPIDEISRNFYLTYGLCSGGELDQCLSCEVSTLALLEEAKSYLEESADKEAEVKVVEKMIENERQKHPRSDLGQASASQFKQADVLKTGSKSLS